MSYRLMLDTNYCNFKSEKDKEKFAENIMYHWAFSAREFKTYKELMDYLNKKCNYHIFFKSLFTGYPSNLIDIFEGVNFKYSFMVTIRDLEGENILVARVNVDGTIQELYYTERNREEKTNEKVKTEEKEDTIEKENTDDDMILLHQSIMKLAKLYFELVHHNEKAKILYCEYDNDDIAIYYSYDGALFIGKTVISKHELLHFGE